MKLWFITVCLALAVGACASAPTTQYYRLSDTAYRLPATQKSNVVLRVVVAEPLKGQNLLYQTDAHTLHFAKQHLWAEPLDIAIRNQLANALNQQNRPVRFVPPSLQNNDTPELTVYIEQFHGRFDGQTQIEGYSVFKHQGKTTAGSNFSVLTAQQGDGYAAMIDSLSTGLQQVATQIAP
ncbi:hypothetical protein ADP71_16280 [Vitreoscilla sp. C1]|uniref:PqiC family protein n=1 Tax=Vitreoscilla sp. (strain C1) TaxID=96942 RepID=UPI000CDC8E83|nr:ABC-type transport auxiliary lipoprotein family protein [Vitreoscilla sp. C1]AUZ05180.1 hypothetical protein ADP71_16280 [Vitreoscilla sp. C1]